LIAFASQVYFDRKSLDAGGVEGSTTERFFSNNIHAGIYRKIRPLNLPKQRQPKYWVFGSAVDPHYKLQRERGREQTETNSLLFGFDPQAI